MSVLISVIVPNYNHAPYLKKRIDSILNQTYQEFELILMDDCSSDNSQTILDSYKDHPKVSHLIYNDRNSGSTFKQWQKGIALAQGQYVWIAESDDWADDSLLETLISTFDTDTSIAYCRSLRIWDPNNIPHFEPSCSYTRYDGKEFIEKKMLEFNTIENASMAIFRKEYVDMQWFDQIGEYTYCGDWLFWIKLAQKGNVVEHTAVLNYFRQHTSKVTSKAKQLGLDFTEGVKIFRYIQSDCNISIPNSVIKYWAQVWIMTRYSFSKGITRKTLKCLISYRPIFLYYIVLGMIKKRYRTLQNQKK